jgi:6-phospho-3-hexuloisomerase
MSDLFTESYALILNELQQSLSHVHGKQVERLLNAIRDANKIFLAGAGRMGILLSTFCMRLNHLGFPSYAVGAINCPPIGSKDLLLVASSSGETPTIREVVIKAEKEKAHIAAITATPSSTIATIASFIVHIEAPSTLMDSGDDVFISKQPMKTLFEQTLFLLLEAAVLALMKLTGQTASDLAQRHGNLE